jgi:hypothetical protein
MDSLTKETTESKDSVKAITTALSSMDADEYNNKFRRMLRQMEKEGLKKYSDCEGWLFEDILKWINSRPEIAKDVQRILEEIEDGKHTEDGKYEYSTSN